MVHLAWHPHPDVWLLIAVLGGGYIWALRRIGPRAVHPVERVVTRRQIIAFAAGLVALWVASDWPVHEVAEQYLYSAHMVQHVLMMLVAPPLLLVGTPDWLLRRLVSPRALRRIVRFATRPFMGLVLLNTMIVVIHVPGVVDGMVRSEGFHLAIHTALVGSALCMWSPVVNRLLELPRLTYPGKMFYLFLQSLVPTVPASWLTFGDGVLYHFYETVPRMWGISAITDQRTAGLIMKLGGGFILWGVIAWYFFKWFAVEEREGVDVLEWNQVDRDLNRAELTSG